MSSPAMPPPPRNAPCPCGSGKKYKHCCGAKQAEPAAQVAQPRSRRGPWLTGLGLVALLAITIVALVSIQRRPAAPKPWEYDPANNRHWDPAHGHWHDGPPPGGTATP